MKRVKGKGERGLSPFDLVVAAGLASVLGAVALIRVYGGESFLTELIAGFGAALLAFMLALTWEADRERRQFARSAEALAEQRVTEVRRRLATIKEELERNRESLETLKKGIPGADPLNPQLLEGAWTASAPRLAELIADYEFTAGIAVAYGRLEELRWRLRTRTERGMPGLNQMIEALVDELLPEVEGLLKEITGQIKSPDLQPTGLVHRGSASLSAAVGTGAKIEAVVIPRSSALSASAGPKEEEED